MSGSGLPERTARFVVNEPPHGKLYILRGYGRRNKFLWLERPSAEHIPAEEWEACREAALAAKDSQLTAADLNGLTIGEAFIRFVVRDAKVQATGKWLVLESPLFAPLYEEGRCPFLVVERARKRTFFRPPEVNLGYAELKKGRRGYGPKHYADKSAAYTALGSGPPQIEWRTVWPIHLGEKELYEILLSQYDQGANYQKDPTEGPIYHAATALTDRLRAFLELLRNKELIAEGIFRGTGQKQEVPAEIFKSDDVYLDIKRNELLRSENETAAPVVVYEFVTVRLASTAASAVTTEKETALSTSLPSPPRPPKPRTSAPRLGRKRKRRKKRDGKVTARVRREMKRDLEQGLTSERLADMLEKEMEVRFKASRDTCRRVRKEILLEIGHLPRK